jgi:hypothetical protein
LRAKVETPADGIDQDLAAVAGGSVGIGEGEVELGLLLVNCRHCAGSPYRGCHVTKRITYIRFFRLLASDSGAPVYVRTRHTAFTY